MFPFKKVVIRSLIWLAIVVAGGMGYAYSTVKGPTPTAADAERAGQIGTYTAYLSVAGLAVIILPESFAVGQKKRAGASGTARKRPANAPGRRGRAR